ncbi:9643_t:CDS:2 [Gigaspora rosea]|nr:9643_t:CDS:2 [Gigaspora rosea]
MNKNQLRELLEGLTTSFVEVANTIANTKKEPEDKRELMHVKQTNKKSHQKKVEEELGNLSEKIEQIALNYVASTSNRPKVPVDDDRCWSARDAEKRHIARNCLLERKQKRDPEERQSTNYVGWVDPYDNNPEGWVEDDVYTLAEKRHQPYPEREDAPPLPNHGEGLTHGCTLMSSGYTLSIKVGRSRCLSPIPANDL